MYLCLCVASQVDTSSVYRTELVYFSICILSHVATLLLFIFRAVVKSNTTNLNQPEQTQCKLKIEIHLNFAT